MAGIWITHVDVKDDGQYAEYLEDSTGVIRAHGGVFIARADAANRRRGRNTPGTSWCAFPPTTCPRVL